MTDITTIIGILLTALFGIVARYLIPLLRARLGAEKFADLARWVGVFVSAAEQTIKGTGIGKKKMGWVKKQLSAKGYAVETDAVLALIEAQVRELKTKAIVLEPADISVNAIAEEVKGWQEEAPPEDADAILDDATDGRR